MFGPRPADRQRGRAGGRFDAGAPITPANDALALADALKHDGHADNATSSGSSDSLCAFGAALFTALASFVLLVLLFPRRTTALPDSRRPHSYRAIDPRRSPTLRAPPLSC